MELAPLTMQDPWAHRVLHDSSTNVQTLSSVPTEVGVTMEQVQLLHHTEEENFRPYLHLRGRVEELIPDVEMPYDISRMAFTEGTGPRFDGFYEFTDAQLAELVSKGYFSADFEVPSQMEGITWDFPGEVDYQVVFPETYDQVPVVFVEMADRNEMLLTEASTEYDLHNYFPDFSRSEEELNQQVEAEQSAYHRQAQQYRGQMRDLFAGEQFEDPVIEPAAAQVRDAEEFSATSRSGQGLPQTVFEQLVARSEQQQEQLEDQLRDAAAEDPESAASLYRDVVAPSARSAFSAQAEQQLREVLEETAASDEVIESEFADAEAEHDSAVETETEAQQRTRKDLRAARERRQRELSASDDIFAEEFDEEPEGPSL